MDGLAIIAIFVTKGKQNVMYTLWSNCYKAMA